MDSKTEPRHREGNPEEVEKVEKIVETLILRRDLHRFLGRYVVSEVREIIVFFHSKTM